MSINCENPVDGSPCGQCFACRALSDPANLDISEIDAASNNGVDEMRDLREKVQYPPVAGKYKVYIIDEVHMLSAGAFNALLKTLEEPPAHAVFILATTEAAKIPATILSRCMRFDFKLIPQADLEARLRYVFDSIGKKYESEAISAIARAGAGSVRDMLSIADTCVSYASGTLTYEDVTTVLGGADFAGIAAFCEAMLCGNAGEAFERAEGFLSAGKSVGVLVKDVMNFLNSCAVAKICRDGKNILALPDSNYAEVLRVAKGADGHSLLRASEIFAEVEQTLKYSASPRILFETAVLKASMPKNDYDIEALFTRIAAIEKRLDEGTVTVVTSSNPQEITAKETPMENKPQEKRAEKVVEKRVEKETFAPDLEAPPDEAETGGNVYFDEEYLPRKKEIKTEQTAVKPIVKSGEKGDAKTVFGTFLRTLRRTGKNGVLFAICMDLEYAYEGEIFTFYTTSETIYNSLMKAEHYPIIKASFEGIGIAEDGFAIRLKGREKDTFNKDLETLKETFGGVKIDVK